jgi:hypothetical protein
MDIKQDPNSIPNFNSGGRIGEHQASEPEQAQSSVLLDPGADGDGAASGEVSTEIAREAEVDAHEKSSDPTKTGPGAIDGLVGAP